MEEGWVEKPRPRNCRSRITGALLLYSNTVTLHLLQWVRALLAYGREAEAYLRKVVLGQGPEKGLSDHERRKYKNGTKLKGIVTPLRAGRLGYLLFMFIAVALLAFMSHYASVHPHTEFERTMLIQADIARLEAMALERKIQIESWPEESDHISSLRRRAAVGLLRVGLLNWENTDDFGDWKFLAGKRPIAVPMQKVAENIGWVNLFPEWIDEEAKFGAPKCPVYPMPKIPAIPYVSATVQLDVVIAQAPCYEPSTIQEGWRHPAILQVLIGAANLAAETGREYTHVLIFSKCRPLVNLFPCKELVEHRGEGWLYYMNVEQLKKRASLPIGTCQLSVQLSNKFYVSDHDSEMIHKTLGREAYTTLLHSGEDFVCGAIATARSIRGTGSTRDLVALVDDTISPESKKGLEEAGWKVQNYVKITPEKSDSNPKDFSMLRLWQLDYDKVIFIESDFIVLRNIDHLFKMPELAASGTTQSVFNAGLMVIEPSNCTFQILMEEMERLGAEVFDVWEFLNRVYPWWHRVPRTMNFLKYFWTRNKETVDYMSRTFEADPPELYAIHYVRGQKPWKCFRDYDCNWNTNQQYASDQAHAQWFKVYDKMPENLQKYCALSEGAKAELEYSRRSAQNEDTPDKHWAIKLTDPRLNICEGSQCDLQLCEANHCDYDAMMKRANPSKFVVNSSKTPESLIPALNSVDTTVASTSVDTTVASTSDDTAVASTSDDTTVASTSDDTTDASTSDDTTVASTSDDTTVASTSDDTTVASTSDDTTVASTSDDTTVASTSDDTTVASTSDDTTVASTSDDTTVASTSDDTTVASTSDDTTEASTSDDTTVASTSDDTTVASTSDDTTEASTSDDTTVASTSDDTTVASTSDDTTVASTSDDTTVASAAT